MCSSCGGWGGGWGVAGGSRHALPAFFGAGNGNCKRRIMKVLFRGGEKKPQREKRVSRNVLLLTAANQSTGRSLNEGHLGDGSVPLMGNRFIRSEGFGEAASPAHPAALL